MYFKHIYIQGKEITYISINTVIEREGKNEKSELIDGPIYMSL